MLGPCVCGWSWLWVCGTQMSSSFVTRSASFLASSGSTVCCKTKTKPMSDKGDSYPAHVWMQRKGKIATEAGESYRVSTDGCVVKRQMSSSFVTSSASFLASSGSTVCCKHKQKK